MRMLTLILLLCAFAGTEVSRAQRAPSQTPDQVAASFYQWYVREIDGLRKPATKSKSRLQQYVSSTLMDTLSKKESVGYVEGDYFLKAQDTLDDWASHIAASVPKVTGDTARTQVTLGATPKTQHLLAVTLVLEHGTWKILRVTNVPDQKLSGRGQ